MKENQNQRQGCCKCPYCGSSINQEDEVLLSLNDSIKRASKGDYSMGLYEAKMIWKYKWVVFVPLELIIFLGLILCCLDLKKTLEQPKITNTEIVTEGGSR